MKRPKKPFFLDKFYHGTQLLGLALLFSACGGSGGPEPAAGQDPAPSAEAPQPQAAAPAPETETAPPPDAPLPEQKDDHAVKLRKPLPSPEEITQLPPDGGEEFNRLIHETSPYLRQHARNPVDWYPWGEEAFEKAKKENKPVFLSVGYSSCHWCHVMEHESFEDEEVAKILNQLYVPVKVDREERPDVDQIYMNATQLFTGRGGWPNSVFLDAQQRPWFCGTYFPKEDRGGRPGFITLLGHLNEAWLDKRELVEEQATRLEQALKSIAAGQAEPANGQLDRSVVDAAVASLRSNFDPKHGGFGGAPKFPPHQSLELLVDVYRKGQNADIGSMLTRTLDEMRRGGVYDHIGGGFHRYATDEKWFLPHFEKMLYDNAQLARVYAEAFVLFDRKEYAETARETYDWVLREMHDEGGGFWSAYDADSEGEEGLYYLWTWEQLVSVLGEQEAAAFGKVYQISKQGNYYEEATRQRTDQNIPHLKADLREQVKDEAARAALRESLLKLRAARSTRIYPMLDDKVLTSWNGLMIGSLARGGQLLKEPRYLEAAGKAADFVLGTMRSDGRLLRTYRKGSGAKLKAYLDDYTFLAKALLELHAATGEQRWLSEARKLMKVLEVHFRDQAAGGYFFTANDHEELLARNKDPYDGAIPSGNGIAAQVLVALAKQVPDGGYVEQARKQLEDFEDVILSSPRGTISFVQAVGAFYDAGHRLGLDALPPADASAAAKPLKLLAYSAQTAVKPGASFELLVEVHLGAGWHVYTPDPGWEQAIPAKLSATLSEGLSLGEVRYPKGKSLKVPIVGTIKVYEGVVPLRVSVTVADDAVGEQQIELAYAFQACDNNNICLEPETLRLNLSVTVSAEADEAPRYPEKFKQP